jgi:hypothetical protein
MTIMETYKEEIMRYLNKSKENIELNKLLKKNDVCDLLGVSIGKLDSMMVNGLPYIKDGRNVRFRVKDIDKYLDKKLITE